MQSRTKRILAVSTVGLVVLIACFGRVHGFTAAQWWAARQSGRVLWCANTSEKVAALTFDDGPDPVWTPRVLEVLKRYGVKATFFEQGRMVRRFPQVTRQVSAAGHELGNHTFSHPYTDRLDADQLRGEIDSCDSEIYRASGVRTALFRPARGDWDRTVYEEMRRRGDYLVLWTVAGEHHEVRSARAMARRVLNGLRPGTVILLHDGAFVDRSRLLAALPMIIEGLRARGYRCVTVSELFKLPARARAGS